VTDGVQGQIKSTDMTVARLFQRYGLAAANTRSPRRELLQVI